MHELRLCSSLIQIENKNLKIRRLKNKNSQNKKYNSSRFLDNDLKNFDINELEQMGLALLF